MISATKKWVLIDETTGVQVGGPYTSLTEAEQAKETRVLNESSTKKEAIKVRELLLE